MLSQDDRSYSTVHILQTDLVIKTPYNIDVYPTEASDPQLAEVDCTQFNHISICSQIKCWTILRV